MKKRLLSALLALCMMLTMMPTVAFAAPGQNVFNNKDAAETATGVTANKTLQNNPDGTYTINLSVTGYSDPSSETQVLPADIVLVVDTSTSMDETVSSERCGCTDFTEEERGSGYWPRTVWVCNECGEEYYQQREQCNNLITRNRLDVAKDAASQFVSGLFGASSDVKIGLYDFSGSNRTNVALTDNEDTLLSAIEGLDMPRWGDGTNYTLGLEGAEGILDQSAEGRQKFVVFLSDGEPQNGQNGVWVAGRLKNSGVTIFTVGIDIETNDNSARNALQNVSSGQDYCYYANITGDSGALNAVLDEIRKVIESTINAGKNAVMTDVINTTYFELVPDSASTGVTVGADGKTLTWDIGDITSATKTASFTVELKDGVTIPDNVTKLHTNDSVELTFESAKLGEEAKFTTGAIGDPTVPVTVITITGDSETVVYDGNNHIVDTCKVSGGYSVTGYKAYGEGTLPGNYDVKVTRTDEPVTVKDSSGKPVTGSYVIRTEPGTLTITDRSTDPDDPDARYEITVEAKSDEFTYDGTEKSVSGLETTTFEVEGNTYTVEGLSASASGTDAGTYTSEVTGEAKVFDSKHRDVTEQFIVNRQDGTLTINPIQITLISETAQKEYDGKPLTKTKVQIVGQYIDDDLTNIRATGTVTYPNTTVPNTIEYDTGSEYKPQNYNIIEQVGQLTVTNRTAKYEVFVQANSDEFVYDGDLKTVTGFETLTVTAENGLSYMVSGLQAEGSGTDANKYTVAVTGEYKVTDSAGRDVTEQFNVTAHPGTLKITARPITLTSASASKEYDGTPLTNNDVSVTSELGFVGEDGFTADVTGSQTMVGSSANSFTYQLTEGTNANNYTITRDFGTLTVNERNTKYTITVTANNKNVKYDGSQQSVTGYTVEGLNEEIFTLSGLSATQTATDAGQYNVVVAGMPVIKDSENNVVTDQFSIEYVKGTLTIEKRNVPLTSATESKVYDGTPLKNDTVTVGGDGFVGEEGATYNVTGSQTLPGSSPNTFTYALNEGTKADNYNITPSYGTLTVTNRGVDPEHPLYEIDVYAKSDTVQYDGESHSVSGFTNETLTYTFNVDGQQVTYTVEGIKAETRGTDAGEYPVQITGDPIVKDADGKVVTEQFIVNRHPGTLTIEKRSVTLTSATASKQYDGSPLTNHDVTVTGDGFAEGEGATYNVTGSQTIVGTSKNTFTYELNDNTKAENYNITQVEGDLTVTNRDAQYEITVVANSGSEKYDGNEKTVSGLVSTTFEVEGNTYTVEGLSASGSGTDAGSYAVNVTGTATVRDAQGNDVTAQFSVKTQSGKLTIGKRTVTLTSGSAEKVYDGTALTNDEITVGGDGFVEGQGAAYDVTGSRTLVGTSKNCFTYELNEGTKADNYEIQQQYGQLTVTNRGEDSDHPLYEITVEANSGTFKYDGAEKTVEGFKTLEFTLDNGQTYTVSGLTAKETQTDAGTYSVNVDGVAVVKDADGNDVSAQFSVSVTSGTLTIEKRDVTLTSGSDEKQYDGTPLTNDKITVGGDGWAAGEGADYIFTGSQTLVGSSSNAFTYTLNADTYAKNYNITKTEGTLTVIWSEQTVAISPADIVIYTGGTGYGGVTDGNGEIIEGTETSGLPQPGFHIELSEDIESLLHGSAGSMDDQKAEDLSEILTFTYDYGGQTREWTMEYVGIYANDAETGEPTRYVYSLNPATVGGEEIPVRIQYTDANGIIQDDDNFTMTESAVNTSYTMTIDSGELDQNQIKASIQIGEQKIDCNVKIDTGTLTVKSTTEEKGTNAIAGSESAVADDMITAVAEAGTNYYVNESEVVVDSYRVQLLVDEVSNSDEFDRAMGSDAMSRVQAENDMYNLAFDTVYLDLVDTMNGNAVATLGDGDKLTIYWPAPSNAAPDSEYRIVHYTEMDRMDVTGTENLGSADTDIQPGELVNLNGNNYIKFEVSSFSPFVLVWEANDNGGSSGGSNNKPDDLNTEDHFAYIIGYPKDYRTGEPTDDESLWPVEPQGDITRAEVATIFFRMLTDDARSENWSQTNDYTDVASTDWYNNAISTLSNMGIISGDPSGAFRPDDSITRAEFTKIAVGFFDKAGDYVDGTYDDVSSSDWYADFIDAAVDLGLIEGYPDGTIRPEATITRAEACTIVNRTLGRVPDKDHLLPADEMRVWPDNSDTNEWYYAQIQEATNSHDYEWIGEENDQIENWTEKLEDRDWAQLEREWSDANSAPGGEVVD